MVLSFETESRVFIFKNVTRVIRIKPDYISFVNGNDRKCFNGEMIAVDIIFDPVSCERIKMDKRDPEILDKTKWQTLKEEL